MTAKRIARGWRSLLLRLQQLKEEPTTTASPFRAACPSAASEPGSGKAGVDLVQ